MAAAQECLAVVASVRHVDTDYDTLIMSGVDRESARAQVHQRVEDIANAWRDGVAMLDGKPPLSDVRVVAGCVITAVVTPAGAPVACGGAMGAHRVGRREGSWRC